MAIKVGLENNILKVDKGTKIEYLNAAWCSMTFDATSVYITDKGRADNGRYIDILFTDFQDLLATPYTTEATIATYLSDKIG